MLRREFIFWVIAITVVITVAICANICWYGRFVGKDPIAEWRQTWPEKHCGIPMEEWPDVARWAFGEDWETREIRWWDDDWRREHPDLLVIKGSDDLYEATMQIYEAYKRR